MTNKFALNSACLAAALVLTFAANEVLAGTESFRDSCHNIQSRISPQGRIITAKCREASVPDKPVTGRFEGESDTRLVIPPEGCRDISNRNGHLVCVRSPLLPGGSWSQSCRDGRYIEGTNFYAACRSAGGDGNGSHIDVASCKKPQLKNINGRLRCE